jgi:hypothetical protein
MPISLRILIWWTNLRDRLAGRPKSVSVLTVCPDIDPEVFADQSIIVTDTARREILILADGSHRILSAGEAKEWRDARV